MNLQSFSVDYEPVLVCWDHEWKPIKTIPDPLLTLSVKLLENDYGDNLFENSNSVSSKWLFS